MYEMQEHWSTLVNTYQKFLFSLVYSIYILKQQYLNTLSKNKLSPSCGAYKCLVAYHSNGLLQSIYGYDSGIMTTDQPGLGNLYQ